MDVIGELHVLLNLPSGILIFVCYYSGQALEPVLTLWGRRTVPPQIALHGFNT